MAQAKEMLDELKDNAPEADPFPTIRESLAELGANPDKYEKILAKTDDKFHWEKVFRPKTTLEAGAITLLAAAKQSGAEPNEYLSRLAPYFESRIQSLPDLYNVLGYVDPRARSRAVLTRTAREDKGSASTLPHELEHTLQLQDFNARYQKANDAIEASKEMISVDAYMDNILVPGRPNPVRRFGGMDSFKGDLQQRLSELPEEERKLITAKHPVFGDYLSSGTELFARIRAKEMLDSAKGQDFLQTEMGQKLFPTDRDRSYFIGSTLPNVPKISPPYTFESTEQKKKPVTDPNTSYARQLYNKLTEPKEFQEGGEVEMPEEQASPFTEAAELLAQYKQTGAPATQTQSVTPPLVMDGAALTRAAESSNNYNVGFNRAGTSDAFGAYQILSSTYKGIQAADPFFLDKKQTSLTPAEQDRANQVLRNMNSKGLMARNVAVTEANLQLAHFLGPKGAALFLKDRYISPAAAAANGGLKKAQKIADQRLAMGRSIQEQTTTKPASQQVQEPVNVLPQSPLMSQTTSPAILFSDQKSERVASNSNNELARSMAAFQMATQAKKPAKPKKPIKPIKTQQLSKSKKPKAKDMLQRFAEGGDVSKDSWDNYIADDMPKEAFSDLSQNQEYLPLNVQRLLDAGAIRVTDPSGNPSGEGFSLVSRWNDEFPESETPKWANRPNAYSTAIDALNKPGPLYDGKYRQILWSAKQAGLNPEDVFLNKPKAKDMLQRFAEGGEVTDEFPEEAGAMPDQNMSEAAKQMLFYKKTAAPTPPTDIARLGKQAGLIGLGFAPGAGVADYFGKFPAVEGGTEPSAVENFQKGNYGTAALQGLGAMGDLAMAVPVAGAAIGSVMKAPRAAQRILSSSTTAKDDLAKMPKKLAPASDIGFYSPTEAAALNVQRRSGSGQAFLNDIMKGENVKSDEISAMGLDNFLKGKTNVTADEIQDYIGQNKIKLSETTYGRPKEDPVGMTKRQEVFDKYAPQIKSLFAEMRTMPPFMKAGDREIANPRLIRFQNNLNDLLLKRDADADVAYKIPETKDTKFQGYALPGGENYREIVLTIPDPKDALMSQVKALGITKDKDKITVNDILQRGGSDELAENWRKTSEGVYKTRHWDETNPLSHLRVSDRVTDGKKTLLVDEVQSDWHQAARDLRTKEVEDLVKSGMSKKEAQASVPKDFGYKSGSKPLDYNDPAYVQARRDSVNALNAFNSASGNRALQATLRAELDRASLVEFNFVNQANKFHEAVPDAPYKEDWYQLTLRRAIKEAVDGGYDRVALPSGARVAERFNLVKQIDNVALYMDELRAYDRAGNTIFTKATDGGKDLSKILGEKNAERLLSSSPDYSNFRYLFGLDIKTGGEGMQKYYDEIYPTYLEKFGKKYGAESGKTTVDVKGKPEPLFYMDITPKMREEFTSGIPMREGGEVRKFI